MEPTLRSTQVLKQEAEDIGLQGKDIAEYVTRQQTLDREERAAWREAQKMQAQADIELAKIRAEADRAEADREAEEKKRADELQAEREKRADEIRFAQIEAAKEQAKIEAEKERARVEGPAEPSQY